MFDELMLVGLGFMFGFTLAEILTDMATGVKLAPSDVSALITAGLLVVGLLVTHWWERRR